MGKRVQIQYQQLIRHHIFFDTTIRENVTLFQNEYFSDDQIIEVLKGKSI